jgi:hypothetical protein
VARRGAESEKGERDGPGRSWRLCSMERCVTSDLGALLQFKEIVGGGEIETNTGREKREKAYLVSNTSKKDLESYVLVIVVQRSAERFLKGTEEARQA